MVVINRIDVTQISPGRYVTEISSLNVPPGAKWPTTLIFNEGDVSTRFTRETGPMGVGRFEGWRYRDGAGRVISVFND